MAVRTPRFPPGSPPSLRVPKWWHPVPWPHPPQPLPLVSCFPPTSMSPGPPSVSPLSPLSPQSEDAGEVEEESDAESPGGVLGAPPRPDPTTRLKKLKRGRPGRKKKKGEHPQASPSVPKRYLGRHHPPPDPTPTPPCSGDAG